jgi:YqaJ-like viral recombinase domain
MNNFVENYSIMKSISEVLERYVLYINSNTNIQNSAIWLEKRRLSVGCSELYKACGTVNQRNDIIKNKIYGSDLSRINAIIWGHVFESSTKLMCELILNTKIHVMGGSIKHDSNVVSCSPDGVGILRVPTSIVLDLISQKVEDHYKGKKRFAIKPNGVVYPAILVGDFKTNASNWSPTTMTKDNYNDEVELVALYEFKSRYSKAVDHTKTDPGYLFQVLGGIEIVKPVYKVGVLAEANFSQVQKFYDAKLSVRDSHRESGNKIFFGSCKYVVENNSTAIEMLPIEFELLHGKKFTVDFDVVDGPYFFTYGDKVIFDDNGFSEKYNIPKIDQPTNIEELNNYFDYVNTFLNRSANKPHYYTNYQIEAMTIKYIAGLEGFISKIIPYCADIIDQVARHKSSA